MMKRYLSLLLFSLTLLFPACTDKGDGFEKAGMSSDIPRMEASGKEIFSYVPRTCQLGFNMEKREFRMHSDTMSDFVVATLSEIPSEKGQKIHADLEWTTERDTKTKSGASFKVEKVEDGTCWLWDRTDKITLVIRILD